MRSALGRRAWVFVYTQQEAVNDEMSADKSITGIRRHRGSGVGGRGPGETHLHTGVSLDAGLLGNIFGNEESYRFARGEAMRSTTRLPVNLRRS